VLQSPMLARASSQTFRLSPESPSQNACNPLYNHRLSDAPKLYHSKRLINPAESALTRFSTPNSSTMNTYGKTGGGGGFKPGHSFPRRTFPKRNPSRLLLCPSTVSSRAAFFISRCSPIALLLCIAGHRSLATCFTSAHPQSPPQQSRPHE